jgi:hypothetical protein
MAMAGLGGLALKQVLRVPKRLPATGVKGLDGFDGLGALTASPAPVIAAAGEGPTTNAQPLPADLIAALKTPSSVANAELAVALGAALKGTLFTPGAISKLRGTVAAASKADATKKAAVEAKNVTIRAANKVAVGVNAQIDADEKAGLTAPAGSPLLAAAVKRLPTAAEAAALRKAAAAVKSAQELVEQQKMGLNNARSNLVNAGSNPAKYKEASAGVARFTKSLADAEAALVLRQKDATAASTLKGMDGVESSCSPLVLLGAAALTVYLVTRKK